jgi:hypothetical protein
MIPERDVDGSGHTTFSNMNFMRLIARVLQPTLTSDQERAQTPSKRDGNEP